jgi:hypothetical protein
MEGKRWRDRDRRKKIEGKTEGRDIRPKIEGDQQRGREQGTCIGE